MQTKPQKSISYIINRYIKHPIYNYELKGIFSDDILIALIVFRVVEVNNSACIRIVDLIGDYKKIAYLNKQYKHQPPIKNLQVHSNIHLVHKIY